MSKSGAKANYTIQDSKNIRHINFSDWKKIDAKEVEVGETKEKPREKFTYIDEMLSVIK